MTSTDDLLLAGLGVAVLGLVGYAMYSRNQAAQTAVTPANANVTQWNPTTQEAYDAWYMQQVNAGNITPPPAPGPPGGWSAPTAPTTAGG